jgi:hypothetical protein
MRTWVRCRQCQARRVLAHHPDWYKRIPKCRSCGAQDYRPVKNYHRPVCECTGYHFIHRKGSKHCDFHPRGLFHQAVRQGDLTPDELTDVLLECAGKLEEECPF